jgi:hypothetical protein
MNSATSFTKLSTPSWASGGNPCFPNAAAAPLPCLLAWEALLPVAVLLSLLLHSPSPPLVPLLLRDVPLSLLLLLLLLSL